MVCRGVVFRISATSPFFHGLDQLQPWRVCNAVNQKNRFCYTQHVLAGYHVCGLVDVLRDRMLFWNEAGQPCDDVVMVAGLGGFIVATPLGYVINPTNA